VCFCGVRFSFSIPSHEIGLENVSEMTHFVLSGTSQSLSALHNLRGGISQMYGEHCQTLSHAEDTNLKVSTLVTVTHIC